MKKATRYSKTALRKSSAVVGQKKKVQLKMVSSEEQNWLLGAAMKPPAPGK